MRYNKGCSDEERAFRISFRASEKDVSQLEYCAKKLGITKTYAAVLAIKTLYEKVNSEEGENELLKRAKEDGNLLKK